MITERQKKILDVIIDEYIHSAQPVSSQSLAEKCDLDLCSASMRIEMKNLTDLGLLEKTYISSGRVPTDKAYRFFVDNIFNNFNEEEQEDVVREKMHEMEIAKLLANLSSTYIVFSYPGKKMFWQAGLENIIKEPEFLDRDFVLRFLSFIDDFYEEQEKIVIDTEIKIFIGQENPIKGRKDLSLICSEHTLNNNEKFRISLVGPKRMDYYNNIKLINSFIKNLDEILWNKKKTI